MTPEDEKILARLLLYLKTADTGFVMVEVNEPDQINSIISYINENLKDKKNLSIDLRGLLDNKNHLYEVQDQVKDNPECEVLLIQNLHTLAQGVYTGNVGLLRDLNFSREPYANLNKLIVFFFPIFFVDLMYKHALDFLDWIPLKFKFEPDKSPAFERISPEREFADEKFTRNRIAYLESTLDKGGFTDKERAERLFDIADGYFKLYENEKALELFDECLEIYRKIGDRETEGQTLNKIGVIYLNIAEYDKALGYFQDALNIFKEILNKQGEWTTLNNIGVIYNNKGDYENALIFYNQSLKISKEIGDRYGEGSMLNNIGEIYRNKGDYENALIFYNQSLEIRKEIGDRFGEGGSLNNIGVIYHNKGDYDNALKYFEQALEIRKEIGDKQGERNCLVNKSKLLERQNKIERAINVMEEAVRIAKKLKFPTLKEDIENLKMLKSKKRSYK
jgi:tetratricopeptide (TPR) repeat protein